MLPMNTLNKSNSIRGPRPTKSNILYYKIIVGLMIS